MPGNAKRKKKALEEQEQLKFLLETIGVPVRCPSIKRFQVGEPCPNEDCKDFGLPTCADDTHFPEKVCGRKPIEGSTHCIGHRYEDKTLKEIVDSNKALREMHEYLTRRVIPKAVQAIEDVLDDDLAPHAERLKAAFGAMDRAGLPSGKQIQVEQVVTVVPPADQIRERLDGVRARLEAAGVVQALPAVAGEVLEEEKDFG